VIELGDAARRRLRAALVHEAQCTSTRTRPPQRVGTRVMVPTRWGTFRLSREPMLEPIERTRAAWAAAGRDRADL
jgi:hypothetical protein